MTYVIAMDIANKDEFLRADERTAFVLGNGPSLRGISLPDLSDYATVGTNAAYRYWREIDWRPRYYACLDLVVGVSHKDAIAQLIREGRIERFLLRNNLIEMLGKDACDSRIYNFDALRAREPFFAADPTTTGSHAALLAASMHYKTIIILGVDARYQQIVAGAERRDGIELEIVKESDNPNYFFEGYQAQGDRYNLPNPRPDLHVVAWRQAGAALATSDAQIYNANAASAVRCFPFLDLNEFLSAGARPAPAEEALPPLTSVSPPASPRQRLRSFAHTFGGKLLSIGAVSATILALWLIFAKPPAALGIAITVMAGVLLAGAAGLFYMRFTILSHLRRQDREIEALKARIADMERRGG